MADSDQHVAGASEAVQEGEDATNEGQQSGSPERVESLPQSSSGRKKKKRKRQSFDLTEDDLLPSHARKTKNGGYAHTNSSKGKISKANAGNTPWNKGRNRSSADKAKIAAGVRARNRAILLEKLKRLGLSEEEYEDKKREIKYLRERIRRAKLANAKHKATEAEEKLKAVIDATTEKEGVAQAPPEEVPKQESPPEGAGNVFLREVIWTPFAFGEEGKSFDQACPTGGPGGLVCCSVCADMYSAYLNQTVKDMEVQRTHRNGSEVKELLQFLNEGRERLERSFDVAKKKIPPLPPPSKCTTTSKPGIRKGAMSTKHAAEATQWNLTSTIDVGFADSFVSI